MTFTIDTGITEDRDSLEFAVKFYIADWFLDLMHGTEPAQLARAFSEQIISEIEKPVKRDTARKHIIAHWGFVRILALHDPAAFDHILTAYADRVAEG